MTTKPGQSRWQAFLENAVGGFNASLHNPLTPSMISLPFLANDLRQAGVDWLNEAPVKVKPAAKAKAPATSLFAAAAPAAAPAPKAAAADPTAIFAAALGGPVTVTSGYRDPQKNAEVGGVKGSDHTKTGSDGKPMAWDIKPPKGMTTADAAKILASQGFGTIDEGDHVHVSRNPVQVARGALQGDSASGFRQIMPTVAPGNTTQMAGVTVPDPMALAGMIPNPRMVPQVDLPNAPQQDLPEAMPALQGMDKTAMLAELTAAIQPKAPDTSGNAWDRVAAMLQGAAQRGAQADPMAGLGQFLLAAGGGAAEGFRTEKKAQKAEQAAYDESVRQAKIVLAKMGFDIDAKNLETGNNNLDRAWKSKENIRGVKFDNKQALDARSVQEILANAGITQQNIGQLNATDRARANVQIEATGAAAAAQNSANSGQMQLNLANKEAGTSEKGLDQEFVSMGLDPNSKDPLVANARSTLIASNAKNAPLAMAGLGQELVLSGHFKEVLGDVDAKLVERALQQKNVAAASQVVTAALTKNITSNPEAVYKLIDELASLGLPSASIISSKRKRTDAPVAAQ